jgi:hypothetical protein
MAKSAIPIGAKPLSSFDTSLFGLLQQFQFGIFFIHRTHPFLTHLKQFGMRFNYGSDLNFDLHPLPFELRNIFMQLGQSVVRFIEDFFCFYFSLGND